MAIRDWFSFGAREADAPVGLQIGPIAAERKANPVSDLIVMNLLGERQQITPKFSLVAQARDGYQKNSTVYACINLIARSCAGIPWVLMQRSAGGKVKKLMSFRTAAKAINGPTQSKAAAMNAEIEDHPLLRLIEKPNPLQSGAEYLEEVMSFLETNGNSYETWVAPETGPNRGQPVELWSLRPDRMFIMGGIIGSGREVSAYRYRVGAGTLDFLPETILHQRFFSPLDDFYGLSPIQVAALTIDGDNAAQLWNQRLLQNDARPPAALVIKNGSLQPEDRERLKAELEARYSGPHNARRPLIAEGDVDWKMLAVSPAELDWLEGRRMNKREIALVYTVPADMVDPESHSYGSVEQARKALYQENVLPTMDRRRDNLNNHVTPLFGAGLYLDYDRDQIEALHEDTGKLYVSIRAADWLTLNEKREATGYDAITDNPDADVPTALLAPSALPGAPEDTQDPGGRSTTTPTPIGAGATDAAKAQRLRADQKKALRGMQKKLDAHFRKQQKALAAHIEAGAR